MSNTVLVAMNDKTKDAYDVIARTLAGSFKCEPDDVDTDVVIALALRSYAAAIVEGARFITEGK